MWSLVEQTDGQFKEWLTAQGMLWDHKATSAVATHPCTRIVFQVGDTDAKKLNESFSFFDAQAFKNLEKFQAIAKVERADLDFNLHVRPLDMSHDGPSETTRQAVIEALRNRRTDRNR